MITTDSMGRIDCNFPRCRLIFYPSELSRELRETIQNLTSASDVIKLIPDKLFTTALKRGKTQNRADRFQGRAKGTWETR